MNAIVIWCLKIKMHFLEITCLIFLNLDLCISEQNPYLNRHKFMFYMFMWYKVFMRQNANVRNQATGFNIPRFHPPLPLTFTSKCLGTGQRPCRLIEKKHQFDCVQYSWWHCMMRKKQRKTAFSYPTIFLRSFRAGRKEK